MSAIQNMTGIPPEHRRVLELRDKAMSGDIAISIVTANPTPAPTAAIWSQVISFKLVDSAGNVHDWFSGDIAATASNTSTAGTAAVSDATPAVVNGWGTVTLSGDAADWLDTETATCRLNGIILGYSLANADFVVTFTAP